MSWTLSITGKGGVGKSTFSAMVVRWLIERKKGAVLAVDADPNACLDAMLGVDVQTSVGGIREEARAIANEQKESTGGMGKTELLDMKIQEALVEANGFDLISMGRPEGPGCYCYANNVLRGVLSRLASQYPFVVIDNEAGLENLSRRTVQHSDWLVFITDGSARGLTTVRRLYDLSIDLNVDAAHTGIIVNRVCDEEALERALKLFDGTKAVVLGGLPEDESLARHDALGKAVFELDETNAVWKAVCSILAKMA